MQTRIYVTLGPYCFFLQHWDHIIEVFKNLFIRRFIYSEINTFSLSKFSKISFAFNIFVPISVQEMVYLKAIQKSTPIGVSVSGTIDQKTYMKKFRRLFQPP